MLLHSQTRAEHKHGKSVLSNNMKTKQTLTWTREKASQTALNNFLVQNTSWLQVQKHKGSNATVCLDKLVYFMLEQTRKIITCSSLRWTIFSFSTFEAHFKFPNLFLLFLLIIKHFQKVSNTFLGCILSKMKCLLQHYSNFDFS